jgi:hypothetical protein
MAKSMGVASVMFARIADHTQAHTDHGQGKHLGFWLTSKCGKVKLLVMTYLIPCGRISLKHGKRETISMRGWLTRWGSPLKSATSDTLTYTSSDRLTKFCMLCVAKKFGMTIMASFILTEKGDQMGQHKYNPNCQLAREGKLPPKPKRMSKRARERLLYAKCQEILYRPLVNAYVKMVQQEYGERRSDG